MLAKAGVRASAEDFTKPETLAAINGWVDERTKGKIPKVLDDLPRDGGLVALNALYFKDKWKHQFDPAGDEAGAVPAGRRPHRPGAADASRRQAAAVPPERPLRRRRSALRDRGLLARRGDDQARPGAGRGVRRRRRVAHRRWICRFAGRGRAAAVRRLLRRRSAPRPGGAGLEAAGRAAGFRARPAAADQGAAARRAQGRRGRHRSRRRHRRGRHPLVAIRGSSR